jgi:hypothetical protein
MNIIRFGWIFRHFTMINQNYSKPSLIQSKWGETSSELRDDLD